jgi:hypothetical protein
MGRMLRYVLVALALAFGVHHTAVATALPGHALHHQDACADCSGGDRESGIAGGDLIAACLALIATFAGIPSLRRLALALWRGRSSWDRRQGTWRAIGAPRAPPAATGGTIRLCVLRC